MRHVHIAAAVVAALAALALLIASDDEFAYRLDAGGAERAALRSDAVSAHLRRHPYTRVEVNPLDEELQRVSFFDGHRLVLDAAVDDRGRTRAVTQRVRGTPATGSELAHEPLVWLLLAALFTGALAGVPRASMRTLDTLALVGFLTAVWAYNEALVAGTVWLGAALLAYLGIRCLQVAVGRAQPTAAPGGEPGLLRMVAVASGAALVVVSLTSPGESDVAFASMAGGTLLNDGVSPYGNMPAEVIHGDTYPLLNYVIHMPAAAWLPVRDSFSDMTGALFVATTAALLAAWGIHATARRHWDETTAWRFVVAWFAFPPVWLTASSGTNDLAAAAAIAWAIALLHHAGRAAGVLTVGAWIKLSPAVLIPLWLARERGPALARGIGAVAAVSLACLGALVALGGTGEIRAMLDALAFQSERGSLYSIWAQLDAEWAQRVAQAALAGGIAAATVMVARSEALKHDPVRLAALAGVLLAGVQLTANYWTFAYLPWLLPPLLIGLFAPPRAASPDAREA